MRNIAILLMLTVLTMPTAALADSEEMLAVAAHASKDSLAVLSFTYTTDIGKTEVTAMAVCVDADGLFMTLATDANMNPESFSDMTLRQPGVGGKSVSGELIGIDEETNIGFVKAQGDLKWKPIEFAKTSALRIGQPIASAGLMPAETGNAPYFGAAYVSSLVRVPGRMVYVTGGKLTRSGSPVLNKEGKAVGIVWGQLPMENQFIQIQQGRRVPVRTQGQQETSFFVPVEEFAHVLAQKGKQRTLSWIGVLKFKPVTEDTAAVLKLERPGVQIEQIIPDTSGAKAGLKERDVIIELNGQPIEELGTPALTRNNLMLKIRRIAPGTPLKLTVFRDGKMIPIDVTTEPMPKSPLQAERFFSRDFGLSVRERVMLDNYMEDSPVAKVPGLIVNFVIQNSPAHRGLVRRGDVIVAIDGKDIRTVDEFKTTIEAAMKDANVDQIKMDVMRGDRKESLTLPISRQG